MTSTANRPEAGTIDLIQRSMRAFRFGLPGIVPVLGTPFAIVAMANSAHIRRDHSGQWNPAQRYLFWGMVCARIGTTLTLLAIIFITGAFLLQLFN